MSKIALYVILLNVNKACLGDINLHNSIKLLNSCYADLNHTIAECSTMIYNYERCRSISKNLI